MRAKKKTGNGPFGDMSDLEILAFCTDPEALATMLIVERKTLRAENARLREALEDLLDDSEVRDFGEWFEDRLKQARAALDPDRDIDPEVKIAEAVAWAGAEVAYAAGEGASDDADAALATAEDAHAQMREFMSFCRIRFSGG